MYKKTVFTRSVILLMLVLAAATHSHAKIIDKVVAVVNNEIITQSEVDRVLYPIYMEYSKIYKTDEELYTRLDKSRIEILIELLAGMSASTSNLSHLKYSSPRAIPSEMTYPSVFPVSSIAMSFSIVMFAHSSS